MNEKHLCYTSAVLSTIISIHKLINVQKLVSDIHGGHGYTITHTVQKNDQLCSFGLPQTAVELSDHKITSLPCLGHPW